MLSISYFCIATEFRYVDNKSDTNLANGILNANSNINKLKNDFVSDKGEFWHSKAVELASTYLPFKCPLVKHYITSYHKHYTNCMEAIVSYIDILIYSHLTARK